MNLLQIGPWPPPLGGWSFHIRMFRQYLDARGIPNAVLNTGPNRRVRHSDYLDVQNFRDYLMKIFRHRRAGCLIYIHLNGNSIKGLVLALAAESVCLATGRRAALSFHAGALQACFVDQVTLQKVLAALAFRLASGIICNSEAVRERIVCLGIAREKIAAIPCFSRQYVRHETVLTAEEEQFLACHNPVFHSYLFFREEYDPDTLFEALDYIRQDFPSFGLVITGCAEGAEPYMAEAAAKGLIGHIFLAGDKDHDNFLSLVERAQIMIRTPAGDGTSSSVLEALALGVPVVASDNGTRPEGVVCFTAGDAADLAGKIRTVMSGLAQAGKCLEGLYGRDTLREEFEFLMNLSEKKASTFHETEQERA